ncbi:MAG: aminotransferase class V-fold PLP-dependent enzyme [Lentisphaeria bacterium]
MELKTYFDYAATCPIRPELQKRYLSYLERYPQNPHGGTCFAEQSRRLILNAERRIFSLLSLPEGGAKIIWTSGSTEALNLAINSAPGKNFAVDSGAHPAMLQSVLAQEKRGCVTHLLPLSAEGKINWSQAPLQHAFDFIALCDLNNETGVCQNLAEIPNINTGSKPIICVDAAQSFGKRKINFNQEKIDYLVLSSRKIGGPGTLGALVYRSNCPIKPVLFGGGQQHNLRSGTLDTPTILLFADAAELSYQKAAEEQKRYQLWNTLLRTELQKIAPDKIIFFSPKTASSPILSFGFRGYEGAIITRMLAEYCGIQVSSGSACSAESHEISLVLKAMGYSDQDARCAIRLSMGYGNTKDQIKDFLHVMPQLLKNY